MRISIWQQFSSNHSASYTVVGEFQSVEAAQSAAETIRQIVKEAGDWTMKNRKLDVKTPTPIEQEYARRYGFDWKERVDWSTMVGRDKATQQLDRLVIIDVGWDIQTWQSGHQFANLLAAMGANVGRNVFEAKEPGITGDIVMGMAFEIRAKAISTEMAASICDELN